MGMVETAFGLFAQHQDRHFSAGGMDGGLQAGRAGAQYHHVIGLGGVHKEDSLLMGASSYLHR
jgi:hypothetical protein